MRIPVMILCTLLCLSVKGQQGLWTWTHGNSTSDQPSVFGTQGVFAPANTPGARYEPCWWTDLSGKFWLFGGVATGQATQLSDLWVFDPAINQWAWMGGSTTVNDPGNYGVQGVASPSNWPKARGWGAVTWTDKQGNLWLFGGSSNLGKMNDLWKYDIVTHQWTWMHGPATPSFGNYGVQGVADPANEPPGRDETKASWVDNSGNLWMFGGDNGAPMNDVWQYDISTNMWTWMHGSSFFGGMPAIYGTKGVAAPANTPGGRAAYSHWTDRNGKFWLYGGDSYDAGLGGRLEDMWMYDPAINMWTWMSGTPFENQVASPGNKCEEGEDFSPGARREATACWTDECGNFYMYGGVQFTDQSDLWHYNINTNQWAWIGGTTASVLVNPVYGTIGVAALSNRPGDRAGTAAWMDKDGNFWMFGGMGNGLMNDLWKYTPDPSCTSTSINAAFSADTLQGCSPFTVKFSGAGSLNASEYEWQFGEGSSSTLAEPSFTYTAPGKYTVTLVVFNPLSCKLTDTLKMEQYITVNDCSKEEVLVPNIFTPNSDNSNDEFVITLHGYLLDELKIYNRWGELVFETGDINSRWNGTNMRTGKAVSDGTYYYLLDVTNAGGKQEVKKGFVTVLH